MKKTLGKLLLSLLFLATLLQASVKVSLSAPAIYKGDTVAYTITSDGDDVVFPDISNVKGLVVEGTSRAQSTSIINGDRTQTTSKTYMLRPSHSLTIPAFLLTEDGKSVKTKEIEIKVLKPTASKDGAPFVLEMQLDKNVSFVGEPVDLSIIFKQKLDAHADKLQLSEPKLENFWVKKVDGVEKSNEGDYIVQKIRYKLFPQKAGTYTIPAIEAKIGKVLRQQAGRGFFNDSFFPAYGRQLNWKKVYSNEPTITVNPLPNDLELYGDYSIKATVDKTRVSANKPVNLTIEVNGEGNIDDIKKFELDIDNVITYADEPEIASRLVDNTYQGDFSQKIALIADRNFTIPAISLEYFDKRTKSVKTITTQPIDIEVKGGDTGTSASKPTAIEMSQQVKEAMKSKPVVKQEVKVVQKAEMPYLKYLYLLLGFLLGASSMYLMHRRKNKVNIKENDIIKEIRKAKDDKALFDILLPYAKEHPVISTWLAKLEENIYKGKKHSIDKEALMEVFEEL